MPEQPIPSSSGLLTDLYELTMAAGYVQNGFNACATFELFVRHLPERRNYLVVSGLDQALDFLTNIRFSEEEISYLKSLPLFRHVGPDFFEYLARFRFTGDLWALPEGTIAFPGEPLLRVTAPIAEAQVVETGLLAIIQLQTLVASKAARVTASASGRPVIEFGSRRAHGIEASVLAARAAFIGGCQGTSNTFAGFRFGIPVYGTQAHSWIMAYQNEETAFRSFLDVFPEGSTLLVDTYDIHAAVDKVIALRRKPRAIRLDSGDILADSAWARKRLDDAGWKDVLIFVSGDLDEDRIEALLRGGACIDSFGVGTALSTSSDVPSLGVIYKLVEVEIDGEVRSTAKFSEEKKTYPGRKQVFRFTGEDGKFCGDVIALADESFPGGKPLLVPVMRNGLRIDTAAQTPTERVQSARRRFFVEREHLPSRLLALEAARPPYPVRYSSSLEALCDQVRQTAMNTPSVESACANIFWAVDLQADFIFPSGRLYVPGADKIIHNVNRLVEAAHRNQIFLVTSADAHNADDPELRQWPPHCLKGTPGAELIPELRTPDCLAIPNQNGFSFPGDLVSHHQVILEKNTLDVFDNPNTDVLLDYLGPAKAVVVFGVATEYCVRCTVEGLLRRGLHVMLVTDAIQPLDPNKGRSVLNDLQSRGAQLLTTDQVLTLLPVPPASPTPRT